MLKYVVDILFILEFMLCSTDFFFLYSRVFQVLAALPTFELDPPTISMTFGVNDSPLAGRDGTHVSSLLKFGIISVVLILHHYLLLLYPCI